MLDYEMSNSNYHASDGISKSQLDVFARSPHHYWWQYKSGESPERKESPAMRHGTIIHSAILEPDDFAESYVRAEQSDKRGKAYKEFVAEQAALGKVAITSTEYEMSMRCRESVEKNPFAMAAFESGNPEVSAFTEDPEIENLKVRARFDWLTEGVIVDLKTTVDAGYGFSSSIRKYRYHLQAAMYSRVAQLCGIKECAFIFVAVERDFPFGVGVYQLDPADMDNGQKLYFDLASRLVECEKNDIWPGYTAGVEILKAYTR